MKQLTASLAIIFLSSTIFSSELDEFGVMKLYPTLPGTREWNSAHWNNGNPRLVQWDGDADDPTGWTDNHSSEDADSLYIDGAGMLMMNGSGPRFHINSTENYSGSNPTPFVAPQFFLNTEATGYFRRLSTGGDNWDGMEIQVRTDALGHGSTGGNDCDATGYASRFRDDGTWDWEKELKHPGSTTQSPGNSELFAEGTIPLGKWIGMKFLTYNVDADAHVKLETYIDTLSDVSNGPPAGGGNWELVNTMIDSGHNWPGGDISGCSDLTQDMAITQGHGAMLIRTDNESCNWKFLSFREIDLSTTAIHASLPSSRNPFTCSVQSGILHINAFLHIPLRATLSDLQGRTVRSTSYSGAENRFSMDVSDLSPGICFVSVFQGVTRTVRMVSITR